MRRRRLWHESGVQPIKPKVKVDVTFSYHITPPPRPQSAITTKALVSLFSDTSSLSALRRSYRLRFYLRSMIYSIIENGKWGRVGIAESVLDDEDGDDDVVKRKGVIECGKF